MRQCVIFIMSMIVSGVIVFNCYAKNVKTQFLDGIDTVEERIDKLWPLNVCTEKEDELARRYNIYFIGTRSDSIFVLADMPKLFYNDMYEFNSINDMIESFPSANVRFWTDTPDTCPNYALVTKQYGDSGDLLYYLERDNIYYLAGGLLETNQLFSISRRCKIGTSVIDLFEFLGLTKLGIDVPDKWLHGIGWLVVNRNRIEIGSPLNNYRGIDHNCVQSITIIILKGRIYCINFDYDWTRIYKETDGCERCRDLHF